MQYIHVALALHSAGKDITVDNIKKMLTAVKADADDSQIKALIAVLEGVNIDEAVKSTPIMAADTPTAAAPARSTAAAPAAEEEPEKLIRAEDNAETTTA